MKIKKVIVVLLTVMLLVSCSGMGSTKSLLNPKKPVTVTLWHYYVGENQQALEQIVSEFNQTVGMEKGVNVDVIALGSIAELEEAVTNSAKGVINARPMPDIFTLYPDKAMELDKMEVLCDLNEYFTEEEKQTYVTSFLTDGIFEDGRFLVLPIVKSTELLYVNETTWNEFAQDTGYTQEKLATWEGVYEVAKAYYEWEDHKTPDTLWDGKGFVGFDSVANFIIVGNKQSGVDVIDASEKQAVLDKTAMRKIFDIYFRGISLGYFNATGKFRSDDIKSGELVAYAGSSSSAAFFPTWIEKNNSKFNIDLLARPYPVFDRAASYAIQQGAGMAIAKSTPVKQEGAALFLKWFTEKEQNIEFAMTTGYLPVKTETYRSEEFKSALDKLKTGDKELQNVSKVYEIALYEIMNADTYAAKPFVGSYDVRRILQKTLMDIAEKGKQDAAALKQQGLTEEEILTALKVDERFEEWLSAIQLKLEEAGISYKK